jgi:hypothetical protein
MNKSVVLYCPNFLLLLYIVLVVLFVIGTNKLKIKIGHYKTGIEPWSHPPNKSEQTNGIQIFFGYNGNDNG